MAKPGRKKRTARPEDIAAPHNDADNRGHIDSQFHGQAYHDRHSGHPEDVPALWFSYVSRYP